MIASEVNVVDHVLTEPHPVAMPNRAIGGGNITSETRGVTGGLGLRNIGLLVKTWGKVIYMGVEGEDLFYIDDGSSLNNASSHKGLKVNCGTLSKPPLYSRVAVVGLSSCEEIEDRVIPVIKLRSQADISLISL